MGYFEINIPEIFDLSEMHEPHKRDETNPEISNHETDQQHVISKWFKLKPPELFHMLKKKPAEVISGEIKVTIVASGEPGKNSEMAIGKPPREKKRGSSPLPYKSPKLILPPPERHLLPAKPVVNLSEISSEDSSGDPDFKFNPNFETSSSSLEYFSQYKDTIKGKLEESAQIQKKQEPRRVEATPEFMKNNSGLAARETPAGTPQKGRIELPDSDSDSDFDSLGHRSNIAGSRSTGSGESVGNYRCLEEKYSSFTVQICRVCWAAGKGV
jgi:hypothetical protein